MLQTWDLWYPAAGAQGLSFARGRLDETDRLIAHSAPDTLRVDVRDDKGPLLAFGDVLAPTEDSPMTLLERSSDHVTRARSREPLTLPAAPHLSCRAA